MSDMEHNKGKLIPTGKKFQILTWEDHEYLEENDLVLIEGNEYKVEWEIRRGDLYGFERATKNSDGTIDFETYHYNGGGHWTECVESALNDQE